MSTTLEILQHALGRDRYGIGTDYRNHFCVGPGSVEFDLCRKAVADGLATESAPSDISGGDYVFRVTRKGKEFVTENSPKPPKLSAGQIRYQKWLDLDNDELFGDYLKRKSRERKCTTPEAVRE